jgi:NADH dehydrogenase FAD-containing subunit
MLLLCSLPDSWDHLVMAIGSTTSSFKIEDVVASLLSKEMRRKSSKMEKEALAIKGRSKEKGRKKVKRSKQK